MRRKRENKQKIGFVIATGVLVFLLNLVSAGFPEFREEKTNTKNQNTEIIVQQATEDQTTEYEDDVMNVHFLDVNQGLCILVQVGDDVLVYDGGGRDTSSFVVAYLKEQGITEIDYMISSHYDADHVSGLIGCLYAFDVKNVIGSNYEHDSNSNSVAIKLSYGESDFIFTGDADYSSERSMIESGIDVDCEVLSLGHHGSASSSSSLFLEKTMPEHAVISCGKDNSYGHPHEEVMELLEGMEIEVFRSDKQGTVVATTDGKIITWSQEPCNDYSNGD